MATRREERDRCGWWEAEPISRRDDLTLLRLSLCLSQGPVSGLGPFQGSSRPADLELVLHMVESTDLYN